MTEGGLSRNGQLEWRRKREVNKCLMVTEVVKETMKPVGTVGGRRLEVYACERCVGVDAHVNNTQEFRKGTVVG